MMLATPLDAMYLKKRGLTMRWMTWVAISGRPYPPLLPGPPPPPPPTPPLPEPPPLLEFDRDSTLPSAWEMALSNMLSWTVS